MMTMCTTSTLITITFNLHRVSPTYYYSYIFLILHDYTVNITLFFILFSVDARNKFKEYVNELATIKNEEVSIIKYKLLIYTIYFVSLFVRYDCYHHRCSYMYDKSTE